MRKHNDANVIAIGQDFLSFDEVQKSIEIFLKTQYLGYIINIDFHRY